jgi:outer membrane protein OmpA-like peptidoglycan-associated protein
MVTAAALACGSPEPPLAPSGAGRGSATAGAGSVAGAARSEASAAAGQGWVDPEPPDAQAAAEAVVGARWNEDKTTRLQMSITTLVDATTGLVGYGSKVVGPATNVEDRLARLGAEVTEAEVTIRLPGSVLFDFDSAQIRPDAERTLNDVAEVLKAYASRPARVEGHTDAIASDQYNQALSERRARSVQSWLASHGIKSTLSASGMGESKPLATNDTAEGRQRNRRVEIVIEKAR